MKKRTIVKKVKYIFVTGGVLSSLGKGIAASSIGSLLECSVLKITILNFQIRLRCFLSSKFLVLNERTIHPKVKYLFYYGALL